MENHSPRGGQARQKIRLLVSGSQFRLIRVTTNCIHIFAASKRKTKSLHKKLVKLTERTKPMKAPITLDGTNILAMTAKSIALNTKLANRVSSQRYESTHLLENDNNILKPLNFLLFYIPNCHRETTFTKRFRSIWIAWSNATWSKLHHF